jgi:phosphate-selective porin OprO/OprP
MAFCCVSSLVQAEEPVIDPASFLSAPDAPVPEVIGGEPGVASSEADARMDRLEAEWKKFKEAQEAKSAKSSDPTFELGGQLIVDALWFNQDADSKATVGDVQDAMDFRRARLYGSGEAFEIFNYAMGFDFAQGSGNNGRPSFVDNYVGVKDLPYLDNLRVGHFFEPFSLERSSSNRNTSFIERSLADAFAPARNLGIMTFHETEDHSLFYALGTFRAGSDNFGDDIGDQEGQTVDGRLVYRPYYDEAADGRYMLHLGGAYSFRDASDGEVRFRSRPEAFGHSTSEGIETPYFVDTGNLVAHNSQLYGAELLWVHGPFSVQGEYMFAPVDRIGANNAVFQGGYIYASYFLTGEHRRYNLATAILDRVRPFENFFRLRTDGGPIEMGLGAWEVAVRVSHIDLSDQDVLGGNLTDITTGLNWYLTPYHRMKFNYIHADLHRGLASTTHIFGLRFDWDF